MRRRLPSVKSDSAVLAYVAEHVLNAVERKRAQELLELRVAERTRELAQANAQLQQQMAERERASRLQAALYGIAALANSEHSDADFYRQLHTTVGGLIDAENFYIALLAADRNRLTFPYAVDHSGDTMEDRPWGLGVTEHVIRQGRPMLLLAADLQALHTQGAIRMTQQHTERPAVCWMGAPLVGMHGVMGVVAVQSYCSDLVFGEQDLQLLTFVSHQIAASVQRRQQAEALHTLNAELEQRVHERTSALQQEVQARQQAQNQLQHQVLHDSLTRLPNRRHLRLRLTETLAQAQHDAARGFALLYLDVDRFKHINDSLGHRAGDAVLCTVAQRLQESVRAPDMVARLSGDEFAVLLQAPAGQMAQAARAIAQRIQERMCPALEVPGGQCVHVSVSCGIALGRVQYSSIDEVLHDADSALYRAKAAGRQCFAFFGEDAPAP